MSTVLSLGAWTRWGLAREVRGPAESPAPRATRATHTPAGPELAGHPESPSSRPLLSTPRRPGDGVRHVTGISLPVTPTPPWAT